ncbi:MAG: hypothetical protein OXI56_11140 [bacterium]|nr:hypothetical protein [bacterium]MDE0602336.1 hypothetical protein [bacterium]
MMPIAHILGGGSTDEWVASGVVLIGLVWLLRRSERRARQRRQQMEDESSGENQ